MGYDWTSKGEIPIKDGVTLEALVNAFNDCAGEEGRFDPAKLMAHGAYDLYDDIDFIWDEKGQTLGYSADSNSGWLDGVWGNYLNEVAEHFAAAGWEGYLGDDQEPEFRGPTPEAIKVAKVGHYLATIEHALAAIKAALAAP